jgi:hypothetical protein
MMPSDTIEIVDEGGTPGEILTGGGENTEGRRQQQRAPSPAAIVNDDDQNGDDDAAGALAQSQKALKDHEATSRRERAERVAAQRRAEEAERLLQEARVGRVEDRAAALRAELESAKTARDAASAAYRAARESGDLDGEQAAIELLTAANVNIRQGEADLARHGAAPRADGGAAPQPQAQPPAQKFTPATQAWIDAHPQFLTDPTYRQMCVAADALARARGLDADTPEYFRDVERTIARELNGDSPQERRMDRGNSGAPPSRGSSNGAGSRIVQTDIGQMRVTEGTGGKLSIAFPNAHERADFEEAARICNMKLADYCHEQVKIDNDRRAGRGTGLITSNGRR